MNEYIFKKLLGKGGYAEVYEVVRTIDVDGKKFVATYAMK